MPGRTADEISLRTLPNPIVDDLVVHENHILNYKTHDDMVHNTSKEAHQHALALALARVAGRHCDITEDIVLEVTQALTREYAITAFLVEKKKEHIK